MANTPITAVVAVTYEKARLWAEGRNLATKNWFYVTEARQLYGYGCQIGFRAVLVCDWTEHPEAKEIEDRLRLIGCPVWKEDV